MFCCCNAIFNLPLHKFVFSFSISSEHFNVRSFFYVLLLLYSTFPPYSSTAVIMHTYSSVFSMPLQYGFRSRHEGSF